MKNLLSYAFLVWNALPLAAQNEIGFRAGLLQNKIHDCFDDRSDYHWQPATLGVNGFFAWQLKRNWHLQAEAGLSRRNTHVTNSGVSHYFSSDYQLKQLEINVLGKLALDIERPRFLFLFGIATGYALSGRQHIAGYAVGNVSVNEYRDVRFDNFGLRRFQIGPVAGLEITQSLFGAGALLFDGRLAYYPEKDLHNCSLPNESRISVSLGYRWSIGKNP